MQSHWRLARSSSENSKRAGRPFYYTGFAPLLLTAAAKRSIASTNVAGGGLFQWLALPGVNAMALASAPGCSALSSFVDALIAKMDATDAVQNPTDSARDLEAQTRQTNEAAIRAAVRNWKTLPGYAASGSEAILQLASTPGR